MVGSAAMHLNVGLQESTYTLIGGFFDAALDDWLLI